jgi:hypothetical protein
MSRAHQYKPIRGKDILFLVAGCLVFLLLTGWWAWSLRTCSAGDCDGVWAWMNEGPVTLRSFAIGFGSGIAFGMIDNCLLFFGMSALDSVFERLPGGRNPNVQAAYGNAMSSSFSAFGAAFVGQAISDITGTDKSPLWSRSIGVFIGGLLGILLPVCIMLLFRGARDDQTH